MQIKKWVADGVTLAENPSECRVNSPKRVNYVPTTDGRVIRIVAPGKQAIDTTIEVGWNYIKPEWKNWLYQLYVSDKKFKITTHMDDTEYLDVADEDNGMIGNMVDTDWTVQIDDFREEWPLSGSSQRYDVVLTLKKLTEAADPIITSRFTTVPHPLIINNPTNAFIDEPMVFIRPSMSMTNPSLSLRYNLLDNPDFEDVEDDGSISDWTGTGWSSDIIYFFEGLRCAATDGTNPFEQTVSVPENSDFTFRLNHFSTDGAEVTIELEYQNVGGIVLGTDTLTFAAATGDWDSRIFFGHSPLYTSKCHVSITSDGVGSLFIDNLLFIIGKNYNPRFSNQRPTVLTYTGTLESGDILSYNMGARSAVLNGGASVASQITGDFFEFPTGQSVITLSAEVGDLDDTYMIDDTYEIDDSHEISDEDDIASLFAYLLGLEINGTGDLVVRYEERWL